MKKINLISFIFFAFLCEAQINEQFSDGDFTKNPTWTGTTQNFYVNRNLNLQSCATATSKSYLFTPSEAFANAVWECKMRIDYPTSASNYAIFYLTSDRNDNIDDCNAYYVQVGGTNDEISLYLQQGTKKTKIIQGLKKRIEMDVVNVHVKVTRDRRGNFALYSKLADERDFYLEGLVQNNIIREAFYTGLMYSNTSKTGECYLFDDIFVNGEKVYDTENPEWISTEIIFADALQLIFSEAMDFSNAFYEIENFAGEIVDEIINDDKCGINLYFDREFEEDITYKLHIENMTDLAGNPLEKTTQNFGIIDTSEPLEHGDILISEIMFEQPLNSFEYIELYNASDKTIDASQIVFTTRKADGTLNTGNSICEKYLFPPDTYLAVSEDAEAVKFHHNCPPESNVINTKWGSLNNTGSCIVITDKTKTIISDEVCYKSAWHHNLIADPKGVALERTSFLLPSNESATWHSASSDTNYGTPGYKNSQYREINQNEREIWIEPEAFSPDNDGFDDVCIIYYKTDAPGYIANVTIFNPNGVTVYKLAKNKLLSTEGVLIWDGKTDTGTNANVGVYILYFEMINPKTGKKKQKKLPIVVSSS